MVPGSQERISKVGYLYNNGFRASSVFGVLIRGDVSIIEGPRSIRRILPSHQSSIFIDLNETETWEQVYKGITSKHKMPMKHERPLNFINGHEASFNYYSIPSFVQLERVMLATPDTFVTAWDESLPDSLKKKLKEMMEGRSCVSPLQYK